MRVYGVILTLLNAFQSSQANVDPEANMSVIDLIRYWGYPAETHDVITDDGYILSLFRIPHGRVSKDSSCHRPPVIMAHGLGAGAAHFVLNPPASSPAFILADAGFDVFLMNNRGTTYSKRHVTLKPWDNKFWQFSLDEFAKYDSPAVIDKVLALTGQSGVYWIGHSQGAALGFATLAELPDYNKKVKALLQIGPLAHGGYAKGAARIVFAVYNIVKPIADLYRTVFGSHEFSFQLPFIYRPLISFCLAFPFLGPETCLDLLFLTAGPPTKTINISRASVYLAHIPGSTSTWNMLHWAQMATNARAEHMDHNPRENLRRYGQETPPPYDYSLIDVPVYLFWSRNDWLTTVEEIEKVLLKKLRKGVVKGGFEIPEYNHFDFAIATDCAEKVFIPISNIVRSHEEGMCER